MKIGIIFKKEFRDLYGDKIEFEGESISIKQESHYTTASQWEKYIYYLSFPF